MAKSGKKTADAGPAPKEGATLSMDVDTFVRTRDSVRILFIPFSIKVNLFACFNNVGVTPTASVHQQATTNGLDMLVASHSSLPFHATMIQVYSSSSTWLGGRLPRRADLCLHPTWLGHDVGANAPEHIHQQQSLLRTNTNMEQGRHRSRNAAGCYSNTVERVYQAHQRCPQ